MSAWQLIALWTQLTTKALSIECSRGYVLAGKAFEHGYGKYYTTTMLLFHRHDNTNMSICANLPGYGGGGEPVWVIEDSQGGTICTI